MKPVRDALAYLATLALVAGTTFVLALLVAGPHAGLLPGWAGPFLVIAGWLIVIAVPVYLAGRLAAADLTDDDLGGARPAKGRRGDAHPVLHRGEPRRIHRH
jgi:hypothetical protein